MKFYFLNKNPHNGPLAFTIHHWVGVLPITEYDGEYGCLIISKKFLLSDKKLQIQQILEISDISKLLFLLDDTPEAIPYYVNFMEFYDILENTLNVSRDRGIVVYNNSFRSGIFKYSNLNTLYFPMFFFDSYNRNISKYSVNLNSDYDFSCFNRSIKPHKRKAVERIIDRNMNCLMTYGSNLTDGFFHESFKSLPEESNDDLEELQYFRGKVNICVESHTENTLEGEGPFDNMIHLTEKTFRNISWGIPFVLISQKDSIKKLQNLGLHTFDSVIDESYDNIIDDDEKIEASLDSAYTLLSKYNSNNVTDILHENIKLIHDFDFLKNKLNEMFTIPLEKYIKDLV